MKPFCAVWLAALIAAVGFGTGWLMCRNYAQNPPQPTPVTDTVVITRTDTVWIHQPVERLRTVVRTDTVWLAADTVRLRDSLPVAFPIQRVRYSDDSTYVAVVSGYNPHLDSLTLLQRHTHIVVPPPARPTPRIALTVGPQAGFYRTPAGWQPGVGVGVSLGITINLPCTPRTVYSTRIARK